MSKELNIFTGEVKYGKNNILLKSNAIGSCVVVVAFDLKKKIGGIAHIMLPGKAPRKKGVQTFRYAKNAIDELLEGMRKNGSTLANIKVSLVGGSNVLQRDDDTIAQANIDSVLEIINNNKIEIVAKSLGGVLRRTVIFDLGSGEVRFTHGDSAEMLLFKVNERSNC